MRFFWDISGLTIKIRSELEFCKHLAWVLDPYLDDFCIVRICELLGCHICRDFWGRWSWGDEIPWDREP